MYWFTRCTLRTLKSLVCHVWWRSSKFHYGPLIELIICIPRRQMGKTSEYVLKNNTPH